VKDPLFALAPLAALRRDEPRAAFVHAGETLDRRMGKALAARARRSSWIRTLGNLSPADVHAAYRQAAVVLSTSRAEGPSLAVLEAMRAGAAVLAPDIPPHREILESGATGLLYRAGDAGSFLRAAGRLARDAALRRRVGRAARRAARALGDPRREARAVAEACLAALVS